MGWISPWALFLGGIEAEIYNAKQTIKAPFRKALRKRYINTYNEKSLFAEFTKSTSTIHLLSRDYSHMNAGGGLFLIHLMRAYEVQGKKVKLIMMGSREDLAKYFRHKLGYTVTDIDGRDGGYKTIFEASMNDFTNVLTIDEDKSQQKEYRERPSFVREMVEQLKKRPADDVIYFVTNLFTYDETRESIKTLGDVPHIRLIHFGLDFPKLRMREQALNVVFPHYEHEINKQLVFNSLTQTFPNIPLKMFKKSYYSYLHFIYEYEGKHHLHFMEPLEKKV